MKRPRVSVVVPAFNAATSIGETLESVLAQTYEDFDVTVVDDGSEDQTAEIVDSFAARDPRVRLVRQARAGVAAARNAAVEQSGGEYIAPLDADDLWDPRKLEMQVRALDAAPARAAICYCWWRNIDPRGEPLYPGPRWRLEGRVFERLVAINFMGSASIPLIRREPLLDVGGYSDRLRLANGRGCEDWDLYLRLADHYEVRVVPEVLVSYRSREQSMSSDLESMRRSHELVICDVRRLHPEIDETTFAISRSNLCLYLAGVQFRLGDLRRTATLVVESFRTHPATTLRFLAASAPTILWGTLRRYGRRR